MFGKILCRIFKTIVLKKDIQNSNVWKDFIQISNFCINNNQNLDIWKKFKYFSSLLLHYQNYVDNCHKQGLLRTMLDRAYRLSSCWSHFTDECNRLETAFPRLKYPKHLVNSNIKSFVDSKVFDQQQPLSPAKETDDTDSSGFTI